MILLPYTQINGAWTIPDRGMGEIYAKMVDECLIETVFYHGEVKSAEQFIGMMKNPKNLVHTIFDESDVLGIFWLNDFSVCSAFGHFCTFRHTAGRSEQIGHMSFDHWFGMKKTNGENLIRVIMGKVPEWNKKAVKYIQKIGMTVLGTIPNSVYSAYTGEYSGAVLAYKENNHGQQQ